MIGSLVFCREHLFALGNRDCEEKEGSNEG